MTENRIGKAPAGTYSLLERIYRKYGGEVVDRRKDLTREGEGVMVFLATSRVYTYINGQLLQGEGMKLRTIDARSGWDSTAVIAVRNQIALYDATSSFERKFSDPPPTIEEMLELVRQVFPNKRRK